MKYGEKAKDIERFFYYRGSDTHSWVNISTKLAKMLWVHSSLSL
jgi:hypothetical protein